MHGTQIIMELHLGLAFSTSSIISLHHSKKRKHYGNIGDDEIHSNSVFVQQSSNNGGVIGWPPMKSWRKKLCHPKTGNRVDGMIGWPPVKICKKKLCYRKIGNGDGGRSKSKSTYVKVNMEGVAIARKVELNRHQSYQTLVHTLANMFDKYIEDVTLTYKDKEGAWLLAGDVSWGSFIKTVQRLRLLKK
ncbi:hypothetical protein QVD17_00428 [Tagetes erecta]|uniref:Auxin-responsive protein n=1 Tax=Tagetes erecta TaxID=13708 RepID=A0AAD8L5S2_TARER|nr:hypothetical protein QVD17_00428 [Tagetes erecta]